MAEKEDELLSKKAVEDKRLVKLVTDDLRDHIRSLEEQVSMTQKTQAKQDSIEK